MMAIANGGGSNIEDRLSLISNMLEEAVGLLRETMSEVRDEADGSPPGTSHQGNPPSKWRSRDDRTR